MEDQDSLYLVVVNHEEQFSIWPSDRAIPDGWREAGKKGTKKECLEHINAVWSDMRPLSLRRSMEAATDKATRPEPQIPAYEPLVDRLCRGQHPVHVNLKQGQTLASVKEQLEGGYLYLRFSETKGSTEVRIRVDKKASNFADADFTRRIGPLHVSGDLILDFVKIQCVADIELSTLQGQARILRL